MISVHRNIMIMFRPARNPTNPMAKRLRHRKVVIQFDLAHRTHSFGSVWLTVGDEGRQRLFSGHCSCAQRLMLLRILAGDHDRPHEGNGQKNTREFQRNPIT